MLANRLRAAQQRAISYAYVTEVVQTSISVTTSPYNATAVAIGTASSDRYIVLCCRFRQIAVGGNITSITVGGVDTTIIKGTSGNTSTFSNIIAVTKAPVASGTTATISISGNFSTNALSNIVIHVYGVRFSRLPSIVETANSTASPASGSAVVSFTAKYSPTGAFFEFFSALGYTSSSSMTGLTVSGPILEVRESLPLGTIALSSGVSTGDGSASTTVSTTGSGITNNTVVARVG